MSFSGARETASQVHQLFGMRDPLLFGQKKRENFDGCERWGWFNEGGKRCDDRKV